MLIINNISELIDLYVARISERIERQNSIQRCESFGFYFVDLIVYGLKIELVDQIASRAVDDVEEEIIY